PVGLVGVVAYVVLGELGLPEVTVSQVTLFLAVYVIGAWTGSRRLAMWSRIAIITAMAIWLYIGFVRFAQLPMEAQPGALTPLAAQTALTVLVNAMYFAGAYWFGNHSWRSAQQRAVLEARTAQLADERERVGRQAVALERLRVARELH